VPWLATDFIWRRVPWARNRQWTPGETISFGAGRSGTVTYRLRGVMRDPDPSRAFATLTLEPVDAKAADVEDRLPATG
jgi:hypothetical protein